MVNNKLRGQTVIDEARHDNGDPVVISTTGVALDNRVRPLRMARLTLTDVEIDIAEADDFGSVALCALPTGAVSVMAVRLDLVMTGDATITDVTAVDYAVGSAALASTDFSGAGEDNLVAENDVAALGVMQVQTTAALSPPVFLDAGSKSIYLNAQATIGTDATVTVTGTVDVFYFDCGD